LCYMRVMATVALFFFHGRMDHFVSELDRVVAGKAGCAECCNRQTAQA
jgi:hypothetical protein